MLQGRDFVRILVFSDTHRQIIDAENVINNLVGVDAVIHCGDHLSDAKRLEADFPGIDFYYVSGNCDGDSSRPYLLAEFEEKKIFITHGHLYNVKAETECEYKTIRTEGKKLSADAVVFGHTHIPYNRDWGDMVVLNPGSIKSRGTYGVIEIENGKLKAATCSIIW